MSFARRSDNKQRQKNDHNISHNLKISVAKLVEFKIIIVNNLTHIILKIDGNKKFLMVKFIMRRYFYIYNYTILVEFVKGPQQLINLVRQ
jgi:hypothetical protein